MSLDTKKRCLIIGDPIAHSLSPLIHNAGYKALGIEDQFSYEASNVKPSELADFMNSVKTEKIHGFTVTIPYKETIIPYIDELDPVAKVIGAVNTVLNDNNKLVGYNTDFIGAVRPLEAITNLKDKKVAVLGAGGASKAFVYGLVQAGCQVTIYNRTPEKAKSIAEHFGCKSDSLENADKIGAADIICNTTSVGLDDPDAIVINPDLLSSQHIVFDAVYFPVETRLLREAKAGGSQIIYGTEMLLHQAFAQFKYFTGHDAPEDAMRKSLTEYLNER